MKKIFMLVIFLCSYYAVAQDLASFSVKPVPGAGISPISVTLDVIDYNIDNHQIALFETSSSGQKEVDCQIETGTSARLWFLFDNREGEKKYVIRRVPISSKESFPVSLKLTEQAMILQKGGLPVLSYNHATTIPAEGVDLIYRRSGYIHPLWSPGGEVLTHSMPSDHVHHYGIWNPWVNTTINGRNVDFWNLRKGQGTVKFAGFLNAVQGPVYAGFKAYHEHVFFLPRGREKVAINEVWDVRVWDTGINGIYVVDLTTTLNTPLDDGILLNAFRYGGGIGFRGSQKWQEDNCTVLTSEGKTRAEADGTKARWSIVEGESAVAEGRSGIVFLSHPSNRMHPEPMHVWGNFFFQFTPTRHDNWKIDPGRDYSLKYRMIVFDGKISPEEAERYWKSFSASPVISFFE